MTTTTYYAPLAMLPWPTTLRGMSTHNSAGYVPLYTTLEALRAEHGDDAPYREVYIVEAVQQ